MNVPEDLAVRQAKRRAVIEHIKAEYPALFVRAEPVVTVSAEALLEALRKKCAEGEKVMASPELLRRMGYKPADKPVDEDADVDL